MKQKHHGRGRGDDETSANIDPALSDCESRPEPDADRDVSKIITPDAPPMLRLILVALLTIPGYACNRTELAYRNADRLLEFYAWQAVDVSATQRQDWRPLLQNTLQSHRDAELPLVIEWLELAGRSIGETQDSAGTACLVDSAGVLYRRHARLAVDLTVPLLASLDHAQISHLGEYISERQENAVRRYLKPDPQARQASRRKRFIDRIETWTGTLDAAQRRQVTDALKRIPDLSSPWLAYRAEQTGRLMRLLETGADAVALREHLDEWWVHRDGWSVEYRQLWRIAREEFVQLMDGLAMTLTDKQRATAGKRLIELRQDLASFISRPQQSAQLQSLPACSDQPA